MNRVGLAVLTSELSHPAPRAHPERPERLRLILEALKRPDLRTLVEDLTSKDHSAAVLEKVHTAKYIKRLASFAGTGLNYLDEDTYQAATSFGASCDVTWALLTAVDEAFAEGPRRSFIIGRPPGHHAEPDRGMGFCLVNHIAVAAQYALDNLECEQVAVVDFDIHHGNGTQNIFYDRDDVLYISTHQFPFWPGSGSEYEQGRGAGDGFTHNYPLPTGTDDGTITALFEGAIADCLQHFGPDLILVSAGFDGHAQDPLGGFSLTGKSYHRIAEVLRGVAEDQCRGRLVSLLEGGYSPEGNLDSITNYVKGLAGT